MAERSRQEIRQKFTDPQRIGLLEDDVDEVHGDMSGVISELNSIKRLLVGVLVSVTTASILLVVNVMTLGGRG